MNRIDESYIYLLIQALSTFKFAHPSTFYLLELQLIKNVHTCMYVQNSSVRIHMRKIEEKPCFSAKNLKWGEEIFHTYTQRAKCPSTFWSYPYVYVYIFL